MNADVAVAICTYNRPLLLERLLEATSSVARADAPDVRISIVIVDDSPAGNARPIAERARDMFADVVYVHTASGDISTARNAALAEGVKLSPFVACVDDDCVPQPGWLTALLRVAGERNAAIVVGHHRFVPTDESPQWLRREPFLQEHPLYEDGAVPVIGNMSNVLIRSSWLSSSGVRFNPHLGRLGGEDMVFFADARASGAEIRFAADSLVFEPCDARRSTFRYQLWRQAWLGNNEAQINARAGNLRRSRLALRGLRRIVRGSCWPFRALADRGRPELRWSIALAASGIGLLTGAAGLELAHRS
jgi:glycosyltransferase involved in cell wall biosynthesis